MAMKYGASGFPIKPVCDEIRKVAALGFDYFELSMDPPEGHWARIRDLKNQIVATLADTDMPVVCHLPCFVYTPDLSPAIRQASLDEMKHSLDAAMEINALKAVLHPGYITGMGVFVMDTARKYAHDGLTAIVAHAADLNLPLCFENMFPAYHLFYEPDPFEPLFREFPQLQMTLDAGHANIGDLEQTRLGQFIRRLAPHIGHVHVSDNFGKKDDHLAVGKGNIDFPSLVSSLKQAGYDDTMTFEVFSPDTQDLVKSRETIEFLFENA
ncbi:MAG: sugar phosphate isomerase/epimerase [Desulfotignum sp.]|nr:sugar phosphate isomerase/epimerase [Desulfotignum sp.]